jgi:TolB protein
MVWIEGRKLFKRLPVLGVTLALLSLQVLVAQVAEGTPPDENGRLVFESYTEANNFQPQVAKMSLDGGERRILTAPLPGEPPAPEWSPDGSRIAFTRCTGEASSCNIWTMRRDGSQKRQITQCMPESCFGNLSPAWAPDGRHIVFERDQRNALGENHPGLFLIRADGTGMRRLTRARTDRDTSHTEPQYSPHGRWIVFTRVFHESDDPNSLMIVSADGGKPHRLTPRGLDSDSPDWSPDRSSIVFTGHPRVPGVDFTANIYTIRPDGTGLRQLTHATPGVGFDFYASWSPDGTRIVFNHAGPRIDDVFTMNHVGEARWRVTHTPNVFEINPDWGPRHD